MQQAFRFLLALLNTVSVKRTVLVPVAILVCLGFAGATIRRVPQNFPTIQSGINAAVNGDTVLVSEGTFFENIRYRGKRITVASLYLMDQDTMHISRTIINGSQPTNPDSGSVVYFINGEDTTSVLCGFTITRGTGTLTNETGAFAQAGGGIFSLSGGTIRKNRIVNNTLSSIDPSVFVVGAGIFHLNGSLGGKLLIIDGNSILGNSIASVYQPLGAGVSAVLAPSRIVDNLIRDNTIVSTNAAALGAGISIYLSPSIIRNNSIISNRSTSPSIDQNSFGGGIFVQQSPVTIEANRIMNNSVLSTGTLSAVGGGVCIFRNADTAATYIRHNYISGNSATGGSGSRGGGLYVLATTTFVENNLIIRNRSARGGGISLLNTTLLGAQSEGQMENNEVLSNHQGIFLKRAGEGSLPVAHNSMRLLPSPQFINNTIANNFASDNGGGFYASTANPIIVNSILYGDTAGQEIFPVSSTVTAVYSNVQGGWTGEGNINSNPLFADTLFRIPNISPCITAGIDSLQIGGVWYRAPRTDFFGSPRPNPAGTRPDIGSHEAPGITPPQAQWLEQNSALPESLTVNSMHAVNQNVVWALGGDFPLNPHQDFARTTNGGTTWTAGVVSGAIGLVGGCISAIDANTAWAAMGDLSFATSGGIYKTTNGGASWARQTTAYPSPGGFVDIVHMFDANNGIAIGDPNGGYYEIYSTNNGGTNWIRVPSSNIPPPLNGEFGLIPGPVFFARNNTLWFGTSQGRIYRSTNRGANWTVASMGLDSTYFVYAISFRDSLNGLSTALNDVPGTKLLRTTDGGLTWSQIPLPQRLLPTWIATVPSTRFYVATSQFVPGLNGSAYSSNDGASWTTVDTLEHGIGVFASPNVGWNGRRKINLPQGGIWKWNGSSLITSAEESGNIAQVPAAFNLEQNYPNPFNPTTEIKFSVAENGRATLKVFNILGQTVATLFDDVAEAGQYYKVKFDGSQLASGVYFYRLQSGQQSAMKKLLLLK